MSSPPPTTPKPSQPRGAGGSLATPAGWGEIFRNTGRWLKHELGFERRIKEPSNSSLNVPHLWPPLVAGLILMLFIVTISPPPMPLDHSVDSSASAVLNFAQAHGLQHGKDIVFTYGPLGFLTFFFYSPHAPWLRLAADAGLGFAVAAGICWLGWRMHWIWRGFFLVTVAWLGGNIWPRTDWVINSGLLCWGLLCFVESGRRLRLAIAGFLGLGVFAALSKASFLVLVSVSVLLLALDLLGRGRRRLALVVLVGFAGGYLIGWVVAGQSLTNLGAYLTNSLAMIRGYNAALGWEGPAMMRASGWRLAWLLPVMIGLRTTTAFNGAGNGWRRCWLTAWVAFMVFTFWKHGWVRVDPFHVGMFLAAVLVLTLALEGLPSERTPRWLMARGVSLLVMAMALASLGRLYVPDLARSLTVPFSVALDHARSFLKPSAYFRRVNEEVALRGNEVELPRLRKIVGHATVDVFGQHAGYALYNDMNYRPRPVFQSYAACNAELMRLNEAFFRSPRAPEFVLFQSFGMDGKPPPLEDAFAFRHLLINYAPVAGERSHLLLQQRQNKPAQLTLRAEGVTRPGERIDLVRFGDADLWLEVEVRPTWLGRLRQFFSRPANVKLGTWRDSTDQWTFRHRSPPSTLGAGFIASPMLFNNDAVLHFYAGTNQVRPKGYSIEIEPEDRKFWSEIIGYRLYEIEGLRQGVLSEASARQIWWQSTNVVTHTESAR